VKLSQLVEENKRAKTSTAALTHVEPPTPQPSRLTNRGKNINARMLETLQQQPEAIGWTSTEWAKHFKCSTAAICNCGTWTQLEHYREKQKAERALDRHRRAKPPQRKG
jgi:hypothetical protein